MAVCKTHKCVSRPAITICFLLVFFTASLMEKNFIDFILIPSVWPETFSYTTEEAMTMGLPVACYDLGAPAERVKKYKKGLIISKIDAQTTLKEIEQFFQR